MKASKHYKAGLVNVVNQRWNPDGTVEVTVYREGWKKAHKFKAYNLGSSDEKIIEDEEVEEG
ncbi:MAG: hypothetical protein QXH51_06790 [Candidatus Bathyarchaeia archaeon]